MHSVRAEKVLPHAAERGLQEAEIEAGVVRHHDRPFDALRQIRSDCIESWGIAHHVRRDAGQALDFDRNWHRPG